MTVQVIWGACGTDNPENESRITPDWGLRSAWLGRTCRALGTHQIRWSSTLRSRTSHWSMFGETLGCRDASNMPNTPRMLATNCTLSSWTENPASQGVFPLAAIVLCSTEHKRSHSIFPCWTAFIWIHFFQVPETFHAVCSTREQFTDTCYIVRRGCSESSSWWICDWASRRWGEHCPSPSHRSGLLYGQVSLDSWQDTQTGATLCHHLTSQDGGQQGPFPATPGYKDSIRSRVPWSQEQEFKD